MPSRRKNPLKRSANPAILKKDGLHIRNPHRERYDFNALVLSNPALSAFVHTNPYGNQTIDFSDPSAVKALNQALLKCFYDLGYWDIPPGCLCPPVPSRADYIHTAADLLAESNRGEIPRGKQVKVLDIGVGASCVYPIIGTHDYGWSFVGTDVESQLLESAQRIVAANPRLTGLVELRLQKNRNSILEGAVFPLDRFDLSICNPPFHASREEALSGTLRKQRNLGTMRGNQSVLNFGGRNSELWCDGGEKGFVGRLIRESAGFAAQFLWFSTLISKQTVLPSVYRALKEAGVAEMKTFDLAQGSKISRVVAWTYKTEKDRNDWKKA